MEIFLLLLDDLDDVTALCRHKAMFAVDEVAHVSGAFTAALVAFMASVLRFPS